VVPPPQLFDDLVALAELEPGARLVEIGCGTGQATLPRAERGFEIVGVELGAGLAEVARRKLAPFPRVTVVVSSFEAGAASTRWSRSTRSTGSIPRSASKSAEVLRARGVLVVVGMRFVAHADADP